jgi:hypothetical protein
MNVHPRHHIPVAPERLKNIWEIRARCATRLALVVAVLIVQERIATHCFDFLTTNIPPEAFRFFFIPSAAHAMDALDHPIRYLSIWGYIGGLAFALVYTGNFLSIYWLASKALGVPFRTPPEAR